MRATETLFAFLLAALAGFALTLALERLLRPAPVFFRPARPARPARSWAVQGGIWFGTYGLCAALLGHPWFASGSLVVSFFILMLVNNAKVASLREPFVFHDFEYFLDAIRHPRLYLPFFGWKKFLAATVGVLLLFVLARQADSLPLARYERVHMAWAGILVAGTAALCLYYASRRPLAVCFEPAKDMRSFGFIPCLWQYGLHSRVAPGAVSPFSALVRTKALELPHMVAVQSESFFDPRTVFPGIRADLLPEYDALKAESLSWGRLRVPAWGANTVRTEFAFLSGLEEARLGVHRFNPYRAVAGGWRVFSLAAFLRTLGYRTVCIHPYYKSFYSRGRVFPALGFDAFWDISVFSDARRSGSYVSDPEIGDTVMEALRHAGGPLFVFVITMENHGPLHLEKPAPGDAEALYAKPPQTGSDDLTVYLRHLRNADAMLGTLRNGMGKLDHPATLCWYGDHVPIMPRMYTLHGVNPDDVEYVFWTNRQKSEGVIRHLEAHRLAMEWCLSLWDTGNSDTCPPVEGGGA